MSSNNIINQYKNLDIELENAINLANESMQTVGERLLYVYNLARQKGYDPKEARNIVEARIINVSPQYLRRMLPQEAKQIQVHDRVKEIETRRKKAKQYSPSIEEDTNNKPFWVDFFVKIGTGGLTFELLIDPVRHKVLESKRKR